MSELLDLANAYYIVAKDLKRRGDDLLDQAEYLSQCGDRICEENMRARSLAEVSNTDGRHQASTLIDAGSSPAGHATTPELGSTHEQPDCPDPANCSICNAVQHGAEDGK